MSTLTQFLGGGTTSPIKSIQRGTITIPNGSSSATATISSVTTSKTTLVHLGNAPSVDSAALLGRIELTNSTTVTATRGGSSTATTTFSYEVVEYN